MTTSATPPRLAAAMDAWRLSIGPENVIDDPATLALTGTATYAVDQSVPAVIRPSTTIEVSQCLRIATENGIHVYPISRGMNWGYGSKVPAESNCVVMDLGRMNRILDYDVEMGTVTVEPGVTFHQLQDILEEHGSKHFMAAPGTSPHASCIGNALDRGWGFGPYSDRFDYSAGMEVVLPDGEVVETGNARFRGSRSAHLFKWGNGPYMDGIFTQSNFGVVTRMTFFVAETPPIFASYVYKIAGDAKLPALMDALRELKMRHIMRTNFKVQSFYRLFMERQQFPAGQEDFLLSPEAVAEAKQKWGIDDWNGFGALYCWSDAQYAAEREIVEQVLRPHVDALVFLDADVMARKDAMADEVLAETGFHLDQILDRFWVNTRLIGVARGKGVSGAYFRKSTPVPDELDLDRDRVGFLWVDPILPLRGTDVRDAADLAGQIMKHHGFEPNLGFNCVTERAIFMTISLVFDREREGDDARAMRCAKELAQRMSAEGFTLGRVANGLMSVLDHAQPASLDLQHRIKEALDPAGILSPGRYEVPPSF